MTHPHIVDKDSVSYECLEIRVHEFYTSVVSLEVLQKDKKRNRRQALNITGRCTVQIF